MPDWFDRRFAPGIPTRPPTLASLLRGVVPEASAAIRRAQAVVPGVPNTLRPNDDDVAAAVASGDPLPEVEFGLHIVGRDDVWRVARVSITEAISEYYEIDLELVASASLAEPPPTLFAGATLTLSRRLGARRSFHGYVRRVEDRGYDAQQHVVRVVLVPELWSLTRRTDSRIFQNMDVLAIVRQVLRDADLYRDRLRVEAPATLRVREQCVQYQETDYSFIRRLLAEEGVAFFFDDSSEHQVLVLVADTRHLRSPSGGCPRVPYASDAVAASVETVRRLAVVQQGGPDGVLLIDYDHTSPDSQDFTRGSFPRPFGTRWIVYEHPAEVAVRDSSGGASRHYPNRLAEIHMEETYTGRHKLAVTANATLLCAGTEFELFDTPSGAYDKRWLVTRVRHEGRAPEVLRGGAQRAAANREDRYHCEAELYDAHRAWRPPRVTPRPRIHGAQTAVVVGPEGEEIYTDDLGRIKVSFHWDYRSNRDEHSSCWVRVAQMWAGGQWGTQFVPRVGMEVVVSFLDGNPDRPLVTGCVNNATHVPSFSMPNEKTRSGFRTLSSPGGGGFNELSFSDVRDAEQVYLHAQRDHDEVVLRNHTALVGVDEHTRVGHDQRIEVGNDRTEIVGGDRTERVAGEQVERIGGSSEARIEGDHTVRVMGTQYTTSLDAHGLVRRDAYRDVLGSDHCKVQGASRLFVKGDASTRMEGNCTTVVGKHDAPRTYVVHAEGRAVIQSSELTEISSEKELVLRVGATRIRITEERIELTGKSGITLRSGSTVVELTPEQARVRSPGKAIVSASEVDIVTDGAQVKLTDEVKIKGTKVKLNPPSSGGETDAAPKPPKPTRLALKDQEGRPLANQRFVIRLADGAEVAGVLDHEGKAEVEVEGGGAAKVFFPDVSETRSV